MPFSVAVSKTGKYGELDSDDLDTIFEYISEALKPNYDVKRADSSTDILREIMLDLDGADLVVADLTSLNPNVMYELGIRHGFCKRTIMLTQDRSELPFDLKGYFCLEYRWRTSKDKNNLIEGIRSLLNNINTARDPRFGPVHTHLSVKALGVADFDRMLAAKRLVALGEELSYLVTSLTMRMKNSADENPDELEYDDQEAKITIVGKNSDHLETVLDKLLEMPPVLPCVDLLITENYIPDGYLTKSDLNNLMNKLFVLRYNKELVARAEQPDKLLDFLLSIKLAVVFARLCLENEWKGISLDDFDLEKHKNALNPQYPIS